MTGVDCDDRGQAHTLEGVVGGLLVVLAVLVAMQVSVVTPLSSSTANQQVGNQIRESTQGVLSTAGADGQLRPTLLYWNATSGDFRGAEDIGFYTSGGPPTAFGERLNETFGTDMAYNVDLHYRTPSGDRETRTLVNSGTPADNAVAVSRVVTLYDDDTLLADGGPTGTELAATETYFAPDIAPGRPLYNVVEIEVVVWQI